MGKKEAPSFQRDGDPGVLHREILAKESCLLLPIENGAPMARLTISANGTQVAIMKVALAKHGFDWLAPVCIPSLAGKTLTLDLEASRDFSEALQNIALSGEPMLEAMAADPLRPHFHFTAPFGWLNDPNGLVWHDGVWHLFYQRNPYDLRWENMHWGHATSIDLVHWVWQADAMLPWTFAKGYCYSGSAVVDMEDAAGFGPGAMLAFFTDTDCGEALAWSSDNGQTFSYFKGNPVLKHQGRDPKVFWHEASRRWIMVVYDELNGCQRNMICSSVNLKDWTRESATEGFYECPELFPLPLDGDMENPRWLMFGADNSYLLGDFDGKAFSPLSSTKKRANYGNCLYAAQTWNSAPDGRRVQIGWAQTSFPGAVFSQAMTVPVEFSLRNSSEGPKLYTSPVKELNALRGDKVELSEIKLGETFTQLNGVSSEPSDIEALFSLGSANGMTLKIAGLEILFDACAAELRCGSCAAPLRLRDGKLKLRILIDHGLLEIFADDGEIYMPLKYSAETRGDAAHLAAAKGPGAILERLTAFKMSSIWRS